MVGWCNVSSAPGKQDIESTNMDSIEQLGEGGGVTSQGGIEGIYGYLRCFLTLPRCVKKL